MRRDLTALLAVALLAVALPVGLLPGSTAAADIEPRRRIDGCRRIVYVTESPRERVRIQSIRANGRGRKVLFSSGERRFPHNPTWSPKARLIAFVRHNYDFDRDLHRDEIWVMRADGSGASRLTRRGEPGIVRTVSWSPDERKLAFSRIDNEVPGSIFVIDLKGRERELVAGTDPAWSPDGDWIAYSTSQGFQDSGHVARIRPDGSDMQVITSPEDATDARPRWEPDSDGLAFLRFPADQQSEDGPYADVWSVELETGAERRLTSRQDDFNGTDDPQYSPNERKILYLDVSDDYTAVKLMRADGSKERMVEQYGYDPDWGRSSHNIAYIFNGKIRVYSTRGGSARTVWNAGRSSLDGLDWAPC